ncbi:MAG: DUF1565 domain-containing protein [Cyanobacteria bacterium P01_C01_bin.120]
MTGLQAIWPAIGLVSILLWEAVSAASIWAVTVDDVTGHDGVDAIAQIAMAPEDYVVIHVNAASGNDADGDGSQLRPYKTITQALRQAEPSTIILLAQGTYSAESGETFPLQLPSLVTIQGMAGPNVADVVILGNGSYYSESTGMQNVTVLGAGNGGIANVTISNTHPEGNGLWIEAGSPVVQDSAFYQNGANGVYVAGDGAPVIRGNYFAENGRAGLVIAGPSNALVEGNIFENTGTGIMVAPDSSPQIRENRVSSNRSGLIIHAGARPTLQGNEIAHNRQDRILDYGAWTATANLGPPGATQPPPPAVNAASTDVEPPNAESAAEIATATAVPELTAASDATAIAASTEQSPPSDALPAPAELTAIPALAAPPMTTANMTTESSADNAAVAPANTDAVLGPPPIAAAAASSPRLETEDSSAEAIAAAPETLSYRSLSRANFGNRLSRQMTATVLAVEAVDISFVPTVTAVAALEEVDLLPIVEAARAIGFAPETSAALAPSDEAADYAESAAPEELLASLPAPADTELSATETEFSEAIEIPVIPPSTTMNAKPDGSQSTSEDLTRDLAQALESGEQLPAVPVAEVAPVAEAGPVTEEEATTLNDSRLAVPNQTIPMGNGGSVPELFTAGAAATLPNDGPPPPPSLAASLGLNYKVLVMAPDTATQDAVRIQVPDAFRTRLQGQVYMQAGAYPTREEAQARLNQLLQAGLSAQIQEIQ